MNPNIIESGHGYKIESFHNGGAYSIIQESTGREQFIQGDDATDFRAEFDNLSMNHAKKPNSRASRFTWPELLDMIYDAWFS